MSIIANDIYVLVEDITLEGEWTPPINFHDWLYGAGHSIFNVSITTVPNIRTGFFNTTTSVRLEYLKLQNINYTAAKSNSETGGLVGDAGYSYFDRIFVSGIINISNFGNVGGIVGDLYSGTIKRSASDVSIDGKNSIGGITYGMGRANASIQDCYSTGTIQAIDAGSESGAILAHLDKNSIVERCFSKTVVISDGTAGGITAPLSDLDNGECTIRNCVAASPSITTSASDSSYIRRVGGQPGSCYVYENNYALDGMTLAYNGTTYTPSSDADGQDGLSKSESELKTQVTYEALGWDFTNVWKMGADGYPALRWLGEQHGACAAAPLIEN